MNAFQLRTIVMPAVAMLMLCIVLTVAIACDTASQPAVTNLASSAALTATLSHNDIAATFNAAKIDFNNKVSTHDAEIATAAIATASQIAANPSYVPPTPIPTSTIIMGVFNCNYQGEKVYAFLTCWQGTINGKLIGVAAGGEIVGHSTLDGSPYGDPDRGIVFVYDMPNFIIYGFSTQMSNPLVYDTPAKMGGVHIASASGTRLLIVTDDPNRQSSWVFDVATRQFYTPSGTPVPVTLTPASATLTPAAP